jgi:tetraacyldisaccharide 4'-kinase
MISVGNLSAGGTGKTPHVEYLVRLLSDNFLVATLSRGYGRKTRGFILAGNEDHSGTIGDEPLQYFHKFNNLIVCTDENRRRGVVKLMKKYPDLDIIILDDAYQHRFVKPGLSILLTDYHKLYCDDYLLPYGTLREHAYNAKRADLIIVTKTPSVLSPIERQQIISDLNPSAHQIVLFSFIKYSIIRSLWNIKETKDINSHVGVILLVAGIANPYPLEYELRKNCNDLIVMRFNDHHIYTSEDIERIKSNYSDIYTRNKLLITTEKDAMRLKNPAILKLAEELPFYYVPMEIQFHEKDKNLFDETIINYVRKNKRKR